MEKQLKFEFNVQTIIYILLIGAFGYFMFTYRDQLTRIADVLQQGVWYYIAASVLVLTVTVYNQASLYASIYNILNLPNSRSILLPLYLVRRFVTVAAPSGGFSGWVPFLEFARRRDIAVGSVFLANLLYSILWYSTFFIFLLTGLIVLFLSHDLEWFEVGAASVILIADIGMIVGLALAWFKPHRLKPIQQWVTDRLDWAFGLVGKEPPIGRDRLDQFRENLLNGVERMRGTDPIRVLRPAGHALANEALHMTMFYLIALAFGLRVNIGVLVAAYSVSILFFIVSPTPGGLGFVEGTLIVVLTSLGVAAERATVITLAYRGITFWLPFIFGFIALRWFEQESGDDDDGGLLP